MLFLQGYCRNKLTDSHFPFGLNTYKCVVYRYPIGFDIIIYGYILIDFYVLYIIYPI